MNPSILFLFAAVAVVFAGESEEADSAEKPQVRSAVEENESGESQEFTGLHTTKYLFKSAPAIAIKSVAPQAVLEATGSNIKSVSPVATITGTHEYKYSSPITYNAPFVTTGNLPLNTFVSKPLLTQYSAPLFYSNVVPSVKAESSESTDDDDKHFQTVFYSSGFNSFSPLISSFPSSSLLTYSGSPKVQTYSAFPHSYTYSAPTVVTSAVEPKPEPTVGVTSAGVTQNVIPTVYSSVPSFSPYVYNYNFLPRTVVAAVDTSDEKDDN